MPKAHSSLYPAQLHQIFEHSDIINDTGFANRDATLLRSDIQQFISNLLESPFEIGPSSDYLTDGSSMACWKMRNNWPRFHVKVPSNRIGVEFKHSPPRIVVLLFRRSHVIDNARVAQPAQTLIPSTPPRSRRRARAAGG